MYGGLRLFTIADRIKTSRQAVKDLRGHDEIGDGLRDVCGLPWT